MLQGDKIENTLVATRLIATTVRIEIDMRDRLSDAEAAADKRIAIGVDSCDEGGIGRIEPNHRRRVAEMRFGRIEALEQRNQTDVRSFVDRCCNRKLSSLCPFPSRSTCIALYPRHANSFPSAVEDS